MKWSDPQKFKTEPGLRVVNPDRWQQVKKIFQGALDLPREDRAAYVRQASGDDDDLFEDVISLITSEAQSDQFLQEPAAEYAPGAFSDTILPDPNVGRRIGPYQIVRLIGVGGMGAVYLAERVDEFRQIVALKLMQRDATSRAVISQFRHERQILASLDHPNLARLLDGGATDDGRPYFVMEYVEGIPISDFCEKHTLSIAERLKIFREVCSAVSYAHNNLIVHRDIKPGNILVTENGTPKLLDFGIAKLLRQDDLPQATLLTEIGGRAMTPEYASPEQVRGLPITTSADVYSLGVVLYELLTGRRPYNFETRAPSEIERVICGHEPSPPSAVVQAKAATGLRGDLDTIVLKSLEKDPQRRYSSVEEMSEDIRRHLEELPITARPQTLQYRTGRYLRRNRVAVAVAILILLSLTGGIIATGWEAHIARNERVRAERRFDDLRNLSEAFLFQFHDMIKDLNGATEAREAVVAKAVEYLNILEKDSAGDTALQLDLAEASLRLGDIQGNPYSAGKGDPTGALARYDQALSLAQSVIRVDPRNVSALRTEARAWRARSAVLVLLSRNEDAVKSARKAIEVFQYLANAYPKDESYAIDLSRAYEALGDKLNPGLSDLSDAKGAQDAYQKALQIWKDLLVGNPKAPNGARALAVLTMKLGDMEMDAGNVEGAQGLYANALASIGAANRESPENLRLEASVRRRLALANADKNPRESVEQFRAAIASRERLLAVDNRDSRARMDLAVVLLDAGHLQERPKGNLHEAIQFYRRALEVLAPVQTADPNNHRVKGMAADIGLRLGRTLVRAGDQEDALRTSSRALDLMRDLADRKGDSVRPQAEYADALLRVEPASLRKPALALKYARMASDSVPTGNASYLDLVAEAQSQSGHRLEAIATAKRALALLPADSPERPRLEGHLKQYLTAATR